MQKDVSTHVLFKAHTKSHTYFMYLKNNLSTIFKTLNNYFQKILIDFWLEYK